MTDLFSRAANIGLGHIREWLPDGKQEGQEWVARNPTRGDQHAGSFKIRMDTGTWCDFATGDSGPDAVSLYAYLNRQECERAADGKRYKNRAGGIQAEAARIILEKYDSSWFPGADDNFEPPKDGKDIWEGYHIVEQGVDAPPTLDTSYFTRHWGPEIERWDFENAKGCVVMKVVRFKKENEKKSDRPFTLWQKGLEIKWRAKALINKYPLWNLGELLERQTDAVLLCEGQKAPSRAKKILNEKYICIGWYGGAGNIEKTDLKPLAGRTVYFWPDADTVGRGVIRVLKTHDIDVRVVHPPTGTRKGWDIADAIEEGWDADKLIALIEGGEKEPEFLDDEAMPFRVLGMSEGNIWVYAYGAKKAYNHASASLNKQWLLLLAPKDKWAEMYGLGEGRIAWDSAIDDIIRKSEKEHVFDTTRIRETGAWRENGNVVINTGEELFIDGKRHELSDRRKEFIYEKSKCVPYQMNHSLSIEESRRLNDDVISNIKFSHETAGILLTGWLLLAPWGGALRWRPHLWITGTKRSGKTWIIDHVVRPMVGEWGISGSGGSTPAGIRQSMKNCSLCLIMDEMESSTHKNADYIEQNLQLFREGSSGDGMHILHGTQDGQGRQWNVSSMVLLGSIGAAIQHGADEDRFTRLQLATLDDAQEIREERFHRLEQAVELLKPEWVKSFHSRTYNLWRKLEECIAVMIQQVTDIFDNRRIGDQLGTLLAGAWIANHDTGPTKDEALSWLNSLRLKELNEEMVEDKQEERTVLEEILASKIWIASNDGRSQQSIGTCLLYWFGKHITGMIGSDEIPEFPGANIGIIKSELEQNGIKPTTYQGEWICIAVGHPSLKKLLKDTPYRDTYGQLLSRLEGVEKGASIGNFAGISKRYLRMSARAVLDTVPF